MKKVQNSPTKVSQTYKSTFNQENDNYGQSQRSFQRKSTMQPSASTTRLEKNWTSSIFQETTSAVKAAQRSKQGPTDAGAEDIFGNEKIDLRPKGDRQFYNL